MSWGLVAGAAGAVGGALISSSATRSAAKGQQAAADAAAAEQGRQFDINIQRQQPFYDAGVGALGRLSGMEFKAPTAESVMSDPGYAFGLKTGRDSLEGSAAARGGLYSGNALRALTRYGTDYGTSKYNDAFERARSAYTTNQNTLTALTNLGTGAANQQQNAGTNYANNVGNIWSNNANAQGAAGIAQGNIWGSLINQGISAGDRNNWWQQPTGITPTFDYNMGSDGAGGYYGNEGRHYADGGQVRKEPKVGTSSPVRSGGGGGLSSEAVQAAVLAPPQPVIVTREGVALLPADPLRNPRSIIENRLRQIEGYACGGPVRHDYMIGGEVEGPGGPRDDMIKAQLSDGEHVVDEKSVTALGKGSNAKGQRKLNALRAMLHRMEAKNAT